MQYATFFQLRAYVTVKTGLEQWLQSNVRDSISRVTANHLYRYVGYMRCNLGNCMLFYKKSIGFGKQLTAKMTFEVVRNGAFRMFWC